MITGNDCQVEFSDLLDSIEELRDYLYHTEDLSESVILEHAGRVNRDVARLLNWGEKRKPDLRAVKAMGRIRRETERYLQATTREFPVYQE